MASVKVNDKVVLKKLSELANAQNLKPAMDEAVELVYEVTQKYPAKDPTAFSKLATNKQKRAYWALVSAGKIRHSESSGYVRENRLKKRWRRRVRALKTKIKGTVFSNSPFYNIYVQSEDDRQPFHKRSGWKTDKEIGTDNEKKIAAIFDEALRNLVK